MDITRQNFQAKLPFVLEDIANADFVAIDLELSGIPGQQFNKPRTDGQGLSGLPTLQERYADIKKAAERYQVLQLGITCALADHSKGQYVLKPYNVFLNPVPDSGVDVERIFSYQTVEFLLRHGFRMEAPYLQGVPYLSRQEEAKARRSRQAKFVLNDIVIKETDQESIRFIESVRDSIDVWRYGRELRTTDYLNIPSADSVTSYLLDRGLNAFQKRLVHQYIRTYHPDLVPISRSDWIQLLPFDKAREDANQARKDRFFERNMEAQIGLRWPVEAMAGGGLSGLTANSFLDYVEGRQEVVAQQVADLKTALKTKRTVLVGHNVFMDLMYFYQCFFGQLPDLVGDFQHIIHGLFPVIIDTKYLATHNHVNPALARSSLEELDIECSAQDFPIIETHETHGKYTVDKPAHEAGYDSFLTAKVLIRLSAKLEAEGQYVEPANRSSDEDYFTPPEDGGVPVVGQRASSPPDIGPSTLFEDGGVPITSDEGSNPPSPGTNTSLGQPYRKKAKKPTKFSHAGRYDLLGDLDMDGREVSISRAQDSTTAHIPPERELTMMPPFDSHFWVVYGNKLRVNGTVEGVCNVLGEGLKGGSDRGEL